MKTTTRSTNYRAFACIDALGRAIVEMRPNDATFPMAVVRQQDGSLAGAEARAKDINNRGPMRTWTVVADAAL